VRVIRVFKGGVPVDPSEYVFDPKTGMISFRSSMSFTSASSVTIEYEEIGEPEWKYGDMGRNTVASVGDFMYVAPDPGKRWHHVMFLTRHASPTSGTIPDTVLGTSSKIEEEA
jgi:hypothetical protein